VKTGQYKKARIVVSYEIDSPGLFSLRVHMRDMSAYVFSLGPGHVPGESISYETTIRAFLYCPDTERVKNMKWGLVVIAAVYSPGLFSLRVHMRDMSAYVFSLGPGHV
jgi:hypothetical protein